MKKIGHWKYFFAVYLIAFMFVGVFLFQITNSFDWFGITMTIVTILLFVAVLLNPIIHYNGEDIIFVYPFSRKIKNSSELIRIQHSILFPGISFIEFKNHKIFLLLNPFMLLYYQMISTGLSNKYSEFLFDELKGKNKPQIS